MKLIDISDEDGYIVSFEHKNIYRDKSNCAEILFVENEDIYTSTDYGTWLFCRSQSKNFSLLFLCISSFSIYNYFAKTQR